MKIAPYDLTPFNHGEHSSDFLFCDNLWPKLAFRNWMPGRLVKPNFVSDFCIKKRNYNQRNNVNDDKHEQKIKSGPVIASKNVEIIQAIIVFT